MFHGIAVANAAQFSVGHCMTNRAKGCQMIRYFYKFERKTADILLGFVELVLIAMSVERAIADAWNVAAVPAAVALVLAIVRFTKGPFVGTPLVEVTKNELILRSFFYLPVKIEKFQLASIKALKIAGLNGERRFRLLLVDGSHVEFRPYYGHLIEPRLIQFLKSALPDISIAEEETPSVLSRIRGNY
jgi:hypothetical protein